jgi:hypothetical protein
MNRRICRLLTLLSIVILTAGLFVTDGWSQKPAPGSQAPTLNTCLPVGIERGKPAELLLTGTNLVGATGLSLGAGTPVNYTLPRDGKDSAKLTVQLTAAPNTPLGLYPLRLATRRGLSNVQLVAVDDVPQVTKNDKNNTQQTAQPLSMPCAVTGRCDAEKADYYRVTVAAGQRLSFDVHGRRLGSPIDPQLSIYHGKTMRELAFDNDSPGCQGDPRLRYTFKEAGDYVIEVKDVLNRGGPDYIYRLRIGDFPLATAPVPMAARRGSKVHVLFAGPHVEGVAPVDVAVPTDPAVTAVWVAPRAPSGLTGAPVALAISDHDELVETEPNNEAAKANRIPVPGGITGRFQQSDDTDCYVFTAKKGQKLQIAAHTLELYSPTLVYMVLKDAKTGADVAKNNPQAAAPADQRIEFTSAADGDYVLEVQHLTYAGGPSEVYRITVAPVVPGFDLVLPADRFELAPGSFVPIPVTVVRRGYTGPIDLKLSGLPGSATVKPNQTAAAIIARAAPDQRPGAYTATVTGTATIDGKHVTESASARAVLSQALNGLPYPPLNLNTQIGIGVIEKAPFTLAVKMDPPEGVPGSKATITITATRDKDFTQDITILPPVNLPPNVPAPKIPAIAKGKNDVSFPLDLNPKAPMGDYAVLFTAKSKLKEGEVTTAALPLDLVVGPPFALKVEPATVALQPGDKAKIKVVATRRGGYKGPITLDARKLPANVTGAKATIAADQTTAELEITAAANAAPAEKTDVDVLGTASALNNLQNASPAFTVRVQKK